MFKTIKSYFDFKFIFILMKKQAKVKYLQSNLKSDFDFFIGYFLTLFECESVN